MSNDLNIDYLQRTDTVLGEVMNSIFDGVYMVDRTRRILFWNRGAEKITGYSADEVMDKHCFDNILNHVDENGHLICKGRCPLSEAMATGNAVSAKIYPLRKDGVRVPVLTNISPIRDGDGEVIAAIEVFRDISTEENYRILQEKFNKIVRKYVSGHAYKEILTQAHLGGDNASVQVRDLTILYLDIVGFTPLAEKSSPEEIVNILNDVFGMCDVITKERNGDIDKFIGDAIMAVFVDANDAVGAGEQILTDALLDLNELRAKEGHEPIAVRIGVNSGNVLQGDVGTADRKDLTVIGDVVNTAERVESICEPNTLTISEATFARLAPETADRFAYVGEVTVKGKTEPLRVFALKR